MKVGSEYYFYHNDHLGTPQKMTAVNGAVVWSAKYSSFGKAKIEVETVINNLRFPGQYKDAETGLYYNWNRYYHNDLGRYTKKDPIGFYSGEINFYQYGMANPILFLDSDGLKSYKGCMTLCILDKSINFGLGFIPGWGGVFASLMPFDIHILQYIGGYTSESGGDSTTLIAPGFFDVTAAAGSVPQAVAYYQYQSLSGDKNWNRYTDLAQRVNGHMRKGKRKDRFVNRVLEMSSKLSKAKKLLSMAGGLANLLAIPDLIDDIFFDCPNNCSKYKCKE